MILADNERRARKRARPSCCRSSARLRRHLRGDGRACRCRSACSIRRCMNSCRTTNDEQARAGEKLGIAGERDRNARVERAARSEPDARPRGCRLGIIYPEIIEMQARAISEAPATRRRRASSQPEIMIPLVGTQKNCDLQRSRDRSRPRAKSSPKTGRTVDYMFGTMIEVAARRADRRRDRRARRVLQLRHQRPDADDLGSAATTPASSCRNIVENGNPARTTRSRRSTATASASWSRSASKRAAAATRT